MNTPMLEPVHKTRIKHILRMFALLVATALASACANESSERADRCNAVNQAVSNCFGKGAPLFDCSVVSDADLDAANALANGPACQLAGEAPIDGDPESASCRLYGIDCVNSIQAPPQNGATKNPIVLVNGIDTSPLFRYSTRIQDALTAQGNRVFLATLTPYQATQKRVPILARRIDEVLAETGASKVNLICHSLGGLDCRYVVSPGGYALDIGADPNLIAAKVASVTTIGTAHRGTRVADAALGSLPGGDAETAINGLASVFGDWFSADTLQNDSDVRAALQALTVSNMLAFNAAVTDSPNVAYQSWAGFSRDSGTSTPAVDARVRTECAPSDPSDGDGLALFKAQDYLALPLVPLYAITGNGETDSDAVEPNDGLVAISSASWGKFRGCIPADHMEQLGQYNLPDVNVRTGVDMAWFYAAVATDLAGQGF